MRARLEWCDRAMVQELEMPTEHLAHMIQFAEHSSPLQAAYWGEELAAIVGLIPGSVLSDVAYLWLYTTPVVRAHSVAFGRLARRSLWEIAGRYSVLIGHCFGANPIPWVRSLGATFDEPQNGIVGFRIVRG